MDPQQAQQELALVRDMIGKTRREAAESGWFLIGAGVLTFVATLAIGLFETFGMNQWVLPLMLMVIPVSVIVAYVTVERKKRREKITTYARTVYLSIWAACGLSLLMAAYLFPLTHVYSYDLVPVLISLILGIAVFSTGVVFEAQRIQWCGAVWWVGACVMAYSSPGILKMVVILTMIALGWVLPGLILNAERRKRVANHGS